MSNQLIKETAQGREQVFPKNYIQNLKDKDSGANLEDILKSFNMLFLSYLGNKVDTRKQVPMSLRHGGLWITYIVDNTIVTEWYDSTTVDDYTWGSDAYWREGSNMLVGDISISKQGTWVINGEDTGISPKGDKGDSPIIRIYNNKIQVSYDKGNTYTDLNDTPVFTQFRFNSNTNTHQVSYDLGQTWQDVLPDKVYYKFKYNESTNTYQVSTDLGKTWSNVSAEKVFYKFRFNPATNTHQVSTDLGNNWVDISAEKVFYKFRTSKNKLQVSTDLGATWEDCSEQIAAWFRWANGDTADSVGKIQISRDEQKTWTDLSPNIVNNLRIKGYVAAVGNLPSNASLGDIYMVGPTYAEDDITHDYPHYRMWVKQSSDWVDNGEYQSNVQMSQTTGQETGITMSQKAITNSIAKQGIYDVSAHNNGAVFESLSNLLNNANLNTLIPVSVRCGGMSIRFIQGSVSNSDNKYVQYRLMSDTFNTTVSNWQGIDDEPTAGSKNLVKSGGVFKAIPFFNDYSSENVNVPAGSVATFNDVFDIKAGSYLICSIEGNTGSKYISLRDSSGVTEENAIIYNNGINGTIIVKVLKDCTGFHIYGGSTNSSCKIKIASIKYENKIFSNSFDKVLYSDYVEKDEGNTYFSNSFEQVNEGEIISISVRRTGSLTNELYLGLLSGDTTVQEDLLKIWPNESEKTIIVKVNKSCDGFKMYSPDSYYNSNFIYINIVKSAIPIYEDTFESVIYSDNINKTQINNQYYPNTFTELKEGNVISIEVNRENSTGFLALSLIKGSNVITQDDVLVLQDGEISKKVCIYVSKDCDGFKFWSETLYNRVYTKITKHFVAEYLSASFKNSLNELAKGTKTYIYRNDSTHSSNNAGIITYNNVFDIKAGTKLLCYIQGNTGGKYISLRTEDSVTQEDAFVYENGANGMQLIFITEDCTGFHVFGTNGEDFKIALYNFEDNTIKKNIIKNYSHFLMTGFDNTIQRLRMYESDNGYDFQEFIHDYNLNNGNIVRDIDLIKKDGWYYLSITGVVLKVYKTQDFVSFTLHSSINPNIADCTDYWAPEIFKDVDGKYYMIFAAYKQASDVPHGYYVTQYIAELNSEFNGFAETPQVFQLPNISSTYHFDTTVCYHNGKYYAASFGNELKIFVSTSLKADYSLLKSVPLQDVATDFKYFEGPTIIFNDDKFFVYVTQSYPSYQKGNTKGVAVYIFDEQWNYIDFQWCRSAVDYPSYPIGETNIIISEHPKILPVTECSAFKVLETFL